MAQVVFQQRLHVLLTLAVRFAGHEELQVFVPLLSSALIRSILKEFITIIKKKKINSKMLFFKLYITKWNKNIDI